MVQAKLTYEEGRYEVMIKIVMMYQEFMNLYNVKPKGWGSYVILVSSPVPIGLLDLGLFWDWDWTWD